jgi:hypothetical protein
MVVFRNKILGINVGSFKLKKEGLSHHFETALFFNWDVWFQCLL